MNWWIAALLDSLATFGRIGLNISNGRECSPRIKPLRVCGFLNQTEIKRGSRVRFTAIRDPGLLLRQLDSLHFRARKLIALNVNQVDRENGR